MADEWRWIVYLSQDVWGGQSFKLERHSSQQSALTAYKRFCKSVGDDSCTARLFPDSQEDWATALEFRESGCPFDGCPCVVFERGPRGGIVVTRCS